MGPVVAPASPARPSFARRRARRLAEPTVLALPVVILILALFRSKGLISDLPIWELVLLLVGGYLASTFIYELWGEQAVGWRLGLQVGIELGVITVVI
ncbi:MAG: hypothetical protein ACRDU0_17015, partial [Mycobacterium sp.]